MKSKKKTLHKDLSDNISYPYEQTTEKNVLSVKPWIKLIDEKKAYICKDKQDLCL